MYLFFVSRMGCYISFVEDNTKPWVNYRQKSTESGQFRRSDNEVLEALKGCDG
jgi:hypothetical protein